MPLLLVIPLLLACTHNPKPGSSDDTAASADGGEPGDAGETGGTELPSTFAFAAPSALSWEHFATAGVCAECHSNAEDSTSMRDAAGRSVAPYDLWGATTMAASARNPYWWAAVAAEKAAQPEHAAEIEGECMTCHAPALVAEARLSGGTPGLTDLVGSDDRAVMGLDGVSCTVCHQIEPADLGTEATFSGQYPILGNGLIYGPYADPFSQPMEMHTGYTPTEGDHLRDPGLCATCHTLTTATLDDDGVPTGQSHHEQSPFPEWQNSRFGAEDITCQDCHVPQLDEDGQPISTVIARHPNGGEFGSIDARSPYGRHTMVGGNAFTLRILRDNREALQPYGSEAAFDENLARTAVFLAQAARVEIGDATAVDDQLEVPVRVVNQAGHKLPTGYPSRRVWLHVVGRDASGTTRFESGAYDDRGQLVGPDGAVRPEELAGGPVLLHADRVDSTGVALWQVVMADATGALTFRLLSASGYLVDDRILPEGWSTAAGEAAGIAPAGVDGDADFVAGSDTVRFVVPAEVETLEVTLLYQSASPRHLAEIFAVDDPLIAAFQAMVDAADPRPETIVTATATLAR